MAGVNNYRTIILREAQLDLEAIIDWYEEQRLGLGETFFSRYQHTEALLAKNPYLFQERLLFVRRAIISRTQHAVYYAWMRKTRQ